MIQFLLGFCCGVIAFGVFAVLSHLRSERQKQRAFEYPIKPDMDATDDIEAFRDIRRRVLDTDGPMTGAQTIELNDILQRLESKGVDIGPLIKEPIRKAARKERR